MDDRQRARLAAPNLRIFGPIGDGTVWDVIHRLDDLSKGDEPLVLELTTEGGDANAALRIALEVRLFRRLHGRETFFTGKTNVLSAGITIMAAFPATHRVVTDDTTLLIHERRLTKTIALDGPMRSNRQILREQLALVETAEAMENRTFADLAEGSRLSCEDIRQRAVNNFYLSAAEALDLGLVAAVV